MAPLWRRWEAIVIAIGGSIARLSESRGRALCEHIAHGGGYGWCRRINGRTGHGSGSIEVTLMVADAVEATGTHTFPRSRSTWWKVGIWHSCGHEAIA